jgi:hypothetical protein
VPSFTIIVPTRSRADTLEHTLRTLTALDDDRLEILVSDNASEDGTREVALGFRDPRLRYVNTGRRVAMTENWEFALGHASGEWIGYLGDDDGLLPDALARVREIIRETKVQAVRSAACDYSWPSLAGTGKLIVPLGTAVRTVDSRSQLSRVLRARDGYHTLPALYNGGFAERALIDRGRDAAGRFFRSRIPDVYSAILLAHLTPAFAYSERPFAVNGASIHSTGTSQFTRSTEPAHTRAARQFHEEAGIPFHSSIPLSRDGSVPRSLHLLNLESWYQVRDLFPGLPDISAEQQLENVLMDAGVSPDMLDWAQDFAAARGLDPQRALRRSALRRGARRLGRIGRQASLKAWHSGLAPARPVANVADAVRLAAEIIADPPSAATMPVRNAVRILRKLVTPKSAA